MSSDGDISVAEALQQLKKRARNDEQPKHATRPAIPWPEPPLPKIRKEESSGPQLPARMLQQKPQLPVQQGPGAGGALSLRPPGVSTLPRPQMGPPAGLAPAGPPIGPAMPPGGLGGLGGPRMPLQLPGKLSPPAVPFGPAAPPTAPSTGNAAPGPDLSGSQVPPVLGGAPNAAMAAGPGKSTVSFEIAQSKVGLLIGKQGATINAIKAYSKANCFVEQQTPDEEQARVTIVGAPAEVEKCKQTINALINGTWNTTMLFQLAGLPPPDGASSVMLDEPLAGLGTPAPGALTATSPMPTPGSLAGALPTAGTLPTALPKPALPSLPGLPGGGSPLPPGPLAAASAMPPLPTAMPSAMPGAMPPQMPLPSQDTQIQEKLNDYYAQWWSQYAIQQQAPEGAATAPGADATKSQPFDKEALARLAEQASKEEDQPAMDIATAPSPEAAMAMAPPVAPMAPLVGDLTERATMEVQQLLQGVKAMSGPDSLTAPAPPFPPPVPMPLSQPGVPPGPPSEPHLPPTQSFSSAPPPVPDNTRPAVGQVPLSGLLNGGFQIKPQTPPGQPRSAQKDNDSVLKMLQTMQGNVIQAKIEKIESKAADANQALARPGAPGVLMGFEPAYPMQELRNIDPQLEALFERLSRINTPQALDTASKDVMDRLPHFSPEQICELLQKLETVPGFSRGELISEVGRSLAQRLREFTGSQFTSLMGSFMAWLSADHSGSAAEKARTFFVSASTEMSSRLMEFAPHEINCCLASLISISYNEIRFFAQVGRAALARHSSFGPVQLTALLSLLSEVRLTHLDLFNAAAQFTVTRTRELRKIDLLRLARSFAKCNIRCDPLCQAIGNEVVSRLKKGDQSEHGGFKVEELCEFTWIFCALQSYHEELFRMTLKQLEERPQVATDALCWLYEIHLVLDREHKEAYANYRIDSDAVQALQQHYKDNRRDVRRCSGKLRSDVASVLKSLVEGSVSANHRTSTGLLVDVAALRKRTSTDGFIHVEIDSSMSVIRALDQEESSASSLLVEGPVALRRRILEKHGLIIVTLRESEWKKLDDSREKRRHLRSQLSALSDVLE